jgi:lysophospholipid acyltransferase (LPLAT)-like uncharacterized protein
MTRWDRAKALLADWLGTWLVHRLLRSLRLRVVGVEQLVALRRRHGPICYCAWHALMLLPIYHHRFTRGYLVVSEHADGELIARVVERIGYTLIRGSTTHGGARALIQAIRVVRAGHEIGITPDGPLGPRYVVQPGIVYLAQKSGCPIVPMGFASSRYWEFRSWDRFRLPKPWSRAELRYGGPIFVPAKLHEQDVEVWRRRVEDALKETTRQAEASIGLQPQEDETT